MKVLIIGAFPDRLNTNVLLRRCAAEGFSGLPEVGLVTEACPEQHARLIGAERWNLVVFMGSILLDWFDLYPRIDAAREALADDGRLVLWLHDDPYEFDTAHRYDGMFDRIYTTDPSARLLYRRREETRWMPLAASPTLHRRELRTPVRAWDFFFCGAGFGNRVALIGEIEAAGHCGRVFGADWPSRLRSAFNVRLSSADLCDYYAAAPVTLALGREHNLRNSLLDLRPAIVGPRVYEAAMAGAAQLLWDPDRQLFGEFEPDVHLLAARDRAELLAGVELLLSDASLNRTLRRNAVEHTLARHTYAHRARDMIADLWP